jgi:hypothetical protein
MEKYGPYSLWIQGLRKRLEPAKDAMSFRPTMALVNGVRLDASLEYSHMKTYSRIYLEKILDESRCFR